MEDNTNKKINSMDELYNEMQNTIVSVAYLRTIPWYKKYKELVLSGDNREQYLLEGFNKLSISEDISLSISIQDLNYYLYKYSVTDYIEDLKAKGWQVTKEEVKDNEFITLASLDGTHISLAFEEYKNGYTLIEAILICGNYKELVETYIQ